VKVSLHVKDKGEAAALRAAWDDPATHALTVVLGVLQTLPTDRARRRVLTWAVDRVEEDHAHVNVLTTDDNGSTGD